MINTVIIFLALFFLSFLVCFVTFAKRVPMEEGVSKQVIPMDADPEQNISKAS